MASESARQFNVAPQDKDKIDSLIHDFSDKNDEDDWESDDDSNETENEKVDVNFAANPSPGFTGRLKVPLRHEPHICVRRRRVQALKNFSIIDKINIFIGGIWM